MPVLPARPSLEHLKNQATTLLRRARAGDARALARFTMLPAWSGRDPLSMDAAALALHDAQSVVAREYGFVSWPALREDVEARTLSYDAAVEAFIRAATGGMPARAERLLALYPAIAHASLHTALVLGDAGGVAGRLRDDPSLATRAGGPLEWEPLLYVCQTCLHRQTPARADGLVETARQLLALGADPDAEYHWNWHPELPRTALWASFCTARYLALAEALLEAGANPTDGVSTHIAGGGGDVAALELLARHGVNVDGVPGGVPPLVHMMMWAIDPAGPTWLLEHGADPNLAWGPDGEAPLHVAARRWDGATIDRLLRHGADPGRRRADGRTALTLAELHGNVDAAIRLRAAGAPDELTPVEQFVAACARGDRDRAAALAEARPALSSSLEHDHHLLLQGAAERGDVRVLAVMLESGFDVNVRDADRVTPLHRASMGGHVDAVRTLLSFGADVRALDGMFAATPLVWAVEGREHAPAGADHVGVARVLLAAGSPDGWTPPDGAPHQERTLEELAELRRAALSDPPKP